MTGKMAIAGMMVAALVVSGIGIMVLAQENPGMMSEEDIEQYTLSEGIPEETTEQHLLTAEQIEAMKAEAQELRDTHATRTEIREAVQAMAHDYVQANLESYGLAPGEIDLVQAKISELMDIWLEIRGTAYELWGQDMNRQDIRAELQPLIEEARAIRGELRDLLDQYGILPPDIRGPGMGDGWGAGPGCEGRPGRGRFGRHGPSP